MASQPLKKIYLPGPLVLHEYRYSTSTNGARSPWLEDADVSRLGVTGGRCWDPRKLKSAMAQDLCGASASPQRR